MPNVCCWFIYKNIGRFVSSVAVYEDVLKYTEEDNTEQTDQQIEKTTADKTPNNTPQTMTNPLLKQITPHCHLKMVYTRIASRIVQNLVQKLFRI